MAKIMLNTNVYCRPFDDFIKSNVKLEAEYTKEIFRLSQRGIVSIFTSEILYYEIGMIKDKSKRNRKIFIEVWLRAVYS